MSLNYRSFKMTLTRFPNGVSSCGVPLTGSVNPFGNVWFVAASGGSNGNSGTDPDHAFSSIQHAIDTGAVGDTIILSPGTHSVDLSADGALIPLADMQFVAAVPPCGTKPSTIVTIDADDTSAVMCTIDVDGVGFHGIEFLLVAGGTTVLDLFDISQTTAVSGLVFNDCWFNLNSVDANVRAICVDDGTNATTGMVVKNCRFLGTSSTTGTATCVVTGVGGISDCLFEGNTFCCSSDDGDAVAFTIADAEADVNYATVIRNNDFIGAMDGAADTIPIAVGGLTAGECLMSVRTNYFAYCAAAAITADKMDGGVINNYTGDNATGGTIVPAGT
jgi:hypothetical protein